MRSRERRLAGHLGSWDSQFRDVAGSLSNLFVFHISFYSFVTGRQAGRYMYCTLRDDLD